MEEAVHKILQVQDGSSDMLYWKHTKNGQCTSKSAYKEFYKIEAQNLQQVDSQSLALIKAIWKDKNIPPKVRAFAWRLIREALPSALRLNHRIKDIHAAYCRCGMPESDFHLFFLCPFSRLTWMIAGYNFDLDRFHVNHHLPSLIAFITNNGPCKISLSTLFITMWNLWKSRNDFKFQGIFREPSQVNYLVEAMINSFSQVASHSDLRVIDYPLENIRRADNIPDGIRCYIDAAWDNGRTGLGIFFHDPQNHSAIFIQASSNKAHSALQAELTALYLALQIAMFLNFLGVTFLTNNATIADTAKKRRFMEEPGHWSF